MPHTSGRPRLFYRTEGKGPLVIMLHGLLMDGQCWLDNGLASAVSPFFHVACPDLPGHGASDKTCEQKFYTRESQTLAIVRLMDELNYEKAHVISYSAGAWLAMGLVDSYPERLDSVILGGWDCLRGLPQTPDGVLSFDKFMAYARKVAPELTAALSSEEEKSAACFFNELRTYAGEDKKLFTRRIPILLWGGASDPYYAAMVELAELYRLPLLSGKGDHLGEVNQPDKTTINGILNFIRDPQTFLAPSICSSLLNAP